MARTKSASRGSAATRKRAIAPEAYPQPPSHPCFENDDLPCWVKLRLFSLRTQTLPCRVNHLFRNTENGLLQMVGGTRETTSLKPSSVSVYLGPPISWARALVLFNVDRGSLQTQHVELRIVCNSEPNPDPQSLIPNP